MIDRREYAPLLQRPSKVDRLAYPAVGDELAERNALGDRLAREVERRARPFDEPALAARGNGERPLAVLVDELRQSHAVVLSSASAPIRVSISAKIRGSVKSLTVRVAPASISVREASVVVMPTTASPAATAERTPERSPRRRANVLRERAGTLERGQIWQWIGLRARASSRADHQDRQTLPIPNAARTFSALARGAFVTTARLSPRRSAKSSNATAPDRLELAQTGAIDLLLGVKSRGLFVGRQMRKIAPRDHFVGGAHDIRRIGGAIERNPVRRKDLLKCEPDARRRCPQACRRDRTVARFSSLRGPGSFFR